LNPRPPECKRIKDVQWENSFEKEFSEELNQLLKDMLKFSTTKIGSNDPSSRANMWDIIKDIINTTLIKSKRTITVEKKKAKESSLPSIQSFIDVYSESYKERFDDVILGLLDAIRQSLKESLGNSYDIAALQMHCANALTFYFEEKYPAFAPKPLSPSIMETAKGYFNDLDDVLKPFLEKLEAAKLPNADKIMVLRGILNQSLDFLFASILKG